MFVAACARQAEPKSGVAHPFVDTVLAPFVALLPFSMTLPRRRADSLYSDIFLPEETQAIRREVRGFCDAVLAPVAHRLNTTPEAKENFPHEIMAAMAKAGCPVSKVLNTKITLDATLL